jgi:hypothetical protein
MWCAQVTTVQAKGLRTTLLLRLLSARQQQ